MVKCTKDFALKTAVELAKINIESNDTWNSPENVTNFIEKVYSFLTAGEENDE